MTRISTSPVKRISCERTRISAFSINRSRITVRRLCALLFACGVFTSLGTTAYANARPIVPGNRAMLRGGIAHAPENAPESVKRAIWAVNQIVRKPYVWGGGHGTFYDRGYDCSGTISYLLHHAGKLASPAPSRELVAHGEAGRGRWITVYARNGHAFAVVAGLRLDTTGFYREDGPRWRPEPRDPSGFRARHPVGL